MLNISELADCSFNFDPKDYAEDHRVTFELVLKNGVYVCSLCNHRLKVSNAAVEQLKSAHLRNAAHQKVMKRRLKLRTRKAMFSQAIPK